MQTIDPQDVEWFPDTGAIAHITADASKLTNLIPYQVFDSVIVGNGHKLHNSHIGEGKIKSSGTTIPLRNVLLVPNIKKKSLLSVSHLTSDYPCFF